MSSDATHIVAVGSPGGVWVSNDGGYTWNTSSPPEDTWSGVAITEDGANIWVTSPAGILWSLDFGATFNPTLAGNNSWGGIAVSSSGSLVLAAAAEAIYISSFGL